MGDFSSLVTMYSIIAWLFYFLAVFGLLILRITDPYCPRPFKVWTVVPILFSTVSAGLLLLSIWEAPISSIVAVVFLSSGLPFYCYGFTRFDKVISAIGTFMRTSSDHDYHGVEEEAIELSPVDEI